MTQHERMRDVREAIADGGAGPQERKALESLADALGDALAEEVPFRPEFKAELRRKLMAQARRTARPWYRRAPVWGAGLGVAAAAAVLALGLQLFGGNAGNPGTAVNPEVSPTPSVQNPGTRPLNPGLTGKLDLQVPIVLVPDEVLPAGAPGPDAMTGLDLSSGLPLYRLTGRVDDRLFSDLAARLGFTLPGQAVTGGGYRVVEGSRTLTLTADGEVAYTDADADEAAGAPTDGADGARAVARRFLDRAMLPVPELQPAVTVDRTFEVVYLQRVEGRPVVNGSTLVEVTGRSGVKTARAFVALAHEKTTRSYDALTAEQAMKSAAERGGGATFTGADLVWVRTVTDQAVVLQPYWRVYGTGTQGARMVRYVAALAR